MKKIDQGTNLVVPPYFPPLVKMNKIRPDFSHKTTVVK